MARPAKVAAALLVADYDFWPRQTLDTTHINQMAEALRAGATLPPVVAERHSRRIVDGFHRTRAALKEFGPTAEIEVFWKTYANEGEMFEEAVNLNASHGRKLTAYDHARILARAKELGISMERIAEQLHIRLATARKESRYAKKQRPDGTTVNVPLKRPLRHLKGEVLTTAQEQYNEAASGWSPAFHANQLILAIEAGIPEMTENLARSLTQLHDMIELLNLDIGEADAA